MDYLHPDIALLLAAIFVLGVFIKLHRETEMTVHGFVWILLGVSMFVLASFFNWFEETPYGYLMLTVTDEEGWDFIVPVFGYAPAGLMFCFGFAEWLRMAFILKKEIEQRKIAEHELKAALAEAGKANTAKDKFLSIMSHELRTPLTAIIGFSEIMSDPKYRKLNASEYADYSEVILKSGNHLLQTVDDILTLTQTDGHLYEISDDIFDASTVITECFFLMAVEAEKAGVVLHKNAPVGIRLHGDKRLFKQIVLNLLSNGVRFNRSNGKVTCSIFVDMDRGCVLRVEDTGVGMTSEEAKRALEPFTQLEDTISRTTGGTGLGLPLVKRFIGLHDGTLEITSQQGNGTTVDAIFPLSRLAQQENEKGASPTGPRLH